MDWKRIIDMIELKTGKTISKEVGCRPQFISDLKSGKSKNPNADFCLKLIDKFQLNPDWLLTGEGEMYREKKEILPESVPQKIPLLRQTVSCGPGQDWDTGDNVEAYIEPLGLLTEGKKLYAFRSRGISMAGVGIQDGDILIFDGGRDQSLQDDIYVFGYNGEAFCKLLRFDSLAQKIHIYSVPNKDMDKAELVKTLDSSAEGFSIFGRVLCWIHENHLMWR